MLCEEKIVITRVRTQKPCLNVVTLEPCTQVLLQAELLEHKLATHNSPDRETFFFFFFFFFFSVKFPSISSYSAKLKLASSWQLRTPLYFRA